MSKQYETFSFSGKSINCYGLEVVRATLRRLGFSFSDFDISTNIPVLFSLYWPEQIYKFVQWRYKSGMKDKKIIVGGNTATANPAILRAYDVDVFLGDGENWDGTLESKFMARDDMPIDRSIVEKITPLPYEDVQDNRRSFCEMSRGCMNKCLFCQYGWLKKYLESDITDIRQVIKMSNTKSLRMFAADRFQHSQYKHIRALMDENGKCDTGSDVSMRFVYKNPEYLQYTNKVRVGVEGMSSRLRSLIGKDFSDNKIVEFSKLVVDAGIKCFDWYMIYGLPTECLDDIKQFSELIKRLDKELPQGYCIALHWNAFTPTAQTPFQGQPSAYGYNYYEAMNKYVFNSSLYKRIKIMHKPRLTSDKTIALRCLAVRSDHRVAKLIYNVAMRGGKFAKDHKFLCKEYELLTGKSLCGGWENESIMPWDKYVNYNKSGMQQVLNKKMEKYGPTNQIQH